LDHKVGGAFAAGAVISLTIYWASADPAIFIPASTFFLIFLVLSIFALIGGAIGTAAWRKGRSYKVFFWLTILLNPVITGLIVAIISPIPTSGTAGERRPMKQCPKCAEEVRAEAQVCRFCGHEFS
jgi:uncharacterized membrane protein